MKELLERESELVAVEEQLGRGSGMLAIEVGAGIGKTSLLEAACRAAQKLGYEVLKGRGSELEADFDIRHRAATVRTTTRTGG
jgi:hypothetical protein